MGLFMTVMGTIVTALIIAFIEGWKLAFVVTGFIPLMIIVGLVQGKLTKGFSEHSKQQQDEAAKVGY